MRVQSDALGAGQESMNFEEVGVMNYATQIIGWRPQEKSHCHHCPHLPQRMVHLDCHCMCLDQT